MNRHIDSMLIAFSTYSRLPVPNPSWDSKSMERSICYFPLVGVPIALLELLAWWGCQALHLGELFRGALMCVIPILITGGIHLDGFCDTSDAISSYQPTQRKLEILKDSHIGAFALIRVAVYLILYLGAVSSLNDLKSVITYGIILCIERAFSGLAVVNVKNARGDGMLHSFTSVADKKAVSTTMVIYCLVGFTGMACVSVWSAVATLAVSLGVFWYFHRLCYKGFGGITGDLAGYFLQLLELASLIAIVVVNANI